MYRKREDIIAVNELYRISKSVTVGFADTGTKGVQVYLWLAKSSVLSICIWIYWNCSYHIDAILATTFLFLSDSSRIYFNQMKFKPVMKTDRLMSRRNFLLGCTVTYIYMKLDLKAYCKDNTVIHQDLLCKVSAWKHSNCSLKNNDHLILLIRQNYYFFLQINASEDIVDSKFRPQLFCQNLCCRFYF